MSLARRAAALLGCLAVLLVAPACPVLAAPAGPALADAGVPEAGYAADRVLVVGVPGLLWSDVDPTATPQLWSLAGDSAIGALSVRSARSTTCLLDGWATAGAGNRARYPLPVDTAPDGTAGTAPDSTGDGAGGSGPADPPLPDGSAEVPEDAVPDSAVPGEDDDGLLTVCGQQERTAMVGLTDPAATVTQIAEDSGTRRFGAVPGALGTAAGGCATVVGRAAGLAVAGGGVPVQATEQLPTDPAAVAALVGACRLGVVSLDDLVGAPDDAPEDPAAGAAAAVARAQALTAVDDAVRVLRAALAELPGPTLLMLHGISEVDGDQAQLHVTMVAGPGFTGGWLTSASTGRTPFVQLIDTAPTALRALGAVAPATMNGQPVRATGDRPALADAVRLLDRANTAAVVHHRSVGTFFVLLVLLDAALVLAGILVLGSGAPGSRVLGRGLPHLAPGPAARARPVLRAACLAAGCLPVSTYLAGVVPWERAGSPRLVLAAVVVLVDLVLAALAAAGPWRHRRLGPAGVVLAVTLVTLLGDAVTGSHLEFDGLLGYDPIVAGRFVGFGNLSFGLLAVSGILLTAALATALGRRAGRGSQLPFPAAQRRATIGGVALGGLVVVVVDGAPFWGRDFGGVLAGLPGFALLGMLLGRVRVTPARLVLVLGTGVVGVSAVAVLDWLRPAQSRTAIGRFVDQLIQGQAWPVVSRKAQANVDILLGSALAWMLPVCLVAAVWLVRRGGLLRSRPGRTPGGLPAADVVVLRIGLTAVALSLVIGALVNDSGVALPATAAAVLLPLMTWLAAAPPVGERDGGTDRAHEPSGSRRGVSVTSRGSTGGTS